MDSDARKDTVVNHVHPGYVDTDMTRFANLVTLFKIESIVTHFLKMKSVVTHFAQPQGAADHRQGSRVGHICLAPSSSDGGEHLLCLSSFFLTHFGKQSNTLSFFRFVELTSGTTARSLTG